LLKKPHVAPEVSDTIAADRASSTVRAASRGFEENRLSFSQRLKEIREGFEPAFWVANFTEIFERVAYYGTTAVLAIYLNEQLHFSSELTGWLVGTFGLVVWFLPILGGTLADRFGFRRALMFAYLIMAVGYFLLGSLAAPWIPPLRHALTDKWLVFIILMIPALGPGVVKPCVAGTTARASNENVRSIGYSIYYTLVNIGGAIGPFMAFVVRKQMGWGVENVFRVGSLSVFLMFWVTLFFYREPLRSGEEQVTSVLTAIKNMFVVLGNLRFVIFLIIFSGFFVIFWQQYISMPLFIRKFVNPNADVDLLLTVDAIVVICFQIAVTFITRKLPAFTAMTLGFLITSIGWMLPALRPTVPVFVAALIRCARRNHPGLALLRIHLAPRPSRPAGPLHGLRVSANRHRIFHRRPARRIPRPAFRRHAGSPAHVVGNFRRRHSLHAPHDPLRPHRETVRRRSVA
jgi:proton-dependent oligopeptide transporter, POT family